MRNKITSVIDHIMQHDLDFFCFCETWLHGDESDRIIIKELSLDGYHFHHVPRKDGRGGGVAVHHPSNCNNVKASIMPIWKG